MTTTAPREKKDRTRPWQRAATRAAILAAARGLIQRAGIDHLSLTAVAREADFAPATVFAYFANKNDLFLSVLADDLATFARSMRGFEQPEQQDDPAAEAGELQTAPAVVAPEPPAPRNGEGAPKRLRLVETPPSDEGSGAPQGDATETDSQQDLAAGPRDDLAPVAPDTIAPNDVLQELALLREAVGRLESRPVDQWLERRLREFERGLAALETRPEKAEAAAAIASIDQSVRMLGARVDAIEALQAKAADELARSMRERAEQAEKRLRETLSDVEGANARAAARLNVLENAAFAVAPEFFQTETRAAPAAPQTGALAEAIGHEAASQAVSGDAPETTAENKADDAAPGTSYLSAARRSALAAAEQGEKKERPQARTNRVSRRTLTLIASGLALVVALIWIGVFVKALAVPAPQHAAARTVLAAKLQHAVAKSNPQSRLMAQAQAGNAKAELVVALNLLDGPRTNDALAARWLTRAARQGEALAAFKLATLYRAGHGVPADAAQAFQWLEVAARKGNCKAMQNLAVAYAEGWGTEKDSSQAARWFTRAAAFGLTDAQFNLGVLYESGVGVPQSLTDAYKWYLVAAGGGDREATARVEALKPLILSSDLAAAEEAAASFKPAPLDQDANVAPVLSQNSAG